MQLLRQALPIEAQELPSHDHQQASCHQTVPEKSKGKFTLRNTFIKLLILTVLEIIINKLSLGY